MKNEKKNKTRATQLLFVCYLLTSGGQQKNCKHSGAWAKEKYKYFINS